MWVFEEQVDGKNLTEIINTEHENVKYLPVCAARRPAALAQSRDLLYGRLDRVSLAGHQIHRQSGR